jgi:hypothetical protein
MPIIIRTDAMTREMSRRHDVYGDVAAELLARKEELASLREEIAQAAKCSCHCARCMNLMEKLGK